MRKRVLWALTALLALPLQASAGQAGKTPVDNDRAALTVTLTGLKNRKGNVLISLFNQSAGFPGKPEKAFRIAVKPAEGFANIEFKNLPPGTYAVAVCHDENGSLKLETGLFGKPKEGVGVSNNVVKKFSAPTFTEASFKIGRSNQTVRVKIHY